MKTKALKMAGGLMAFTCLTVLLLSFSTAEKTKTDGCLIMVGIAYKDYTCNGGSVSSTFSNAAGYRYMTSGNTRDYNTLNADIHDNLTQNYQITRNNVSISSSSTSSVCVIIEYDKEISGWNCSLNRYAVGYGNSVQDAEAHAVRQKNSDSRSSSYNVVKTIYCN